MDIKQIAAKEPRLLPIFDEAESVKDLPYWEKNRFWYKNLKPRMENLVGFYIDDEELSTCEIYDTVYRHCLDVMEL